MKPAVKKLLMAAVLLLLAALCLLFLFGSTDDMVTVTYEDKSTGETVEENRLGIYALVGGRVEFKRIEVVTEGGGYYVVRAAGSGSSALRAGDEIIVQGTGLYDGQLLEF